MIALEEEREHHVGLLQHLEAVDHQRVIVQQQRPLLRRGVLQVPDLPVQEVRVLRVDAGDVVVRDRHRRSRTSAHSSTSRRIELESLRPSGRTPAGVSRSRRRSSSGRLGQVEPRHHVGEQVVVDDRGVLVRPGDAVDVERTCSPSPFSRQKPRSAHIRAVSTRMSTPSRFMKS